MACRHGHKHSTPNQTPSPEEVTEAEKQPKVTAIWKTAGLKIPDPKSTAATEPAVGKSKKKAAAIVKTVAARPTVPNLAVPTQSSSSQLEEITYLEACVDLTRRVFTYISFLPAAAARRRSVFKTLIQYGSTP
jgi:hypothetical protein